MRHQPWRREIQSHADHKVVGIVWTCWNLNGPVISQYLQKLWLSFTAWSELCSTSLGCVTRPWNSCHLHQYIPESRHGRAQGDMSRWIRWWRSLIEEGAHTDQLDMLVCRQRRRNKVGTPLWARLQMQAWAPNLSCRRIYGDRWWDLQAQCGAWRLFWFPALPLYNQQRIDILQTTSILAQLSMHNRVAGTYWKACTDLHMLHGKELRA